jgi:hypothetical protein
MEIGIVEGGVDKEQHGVSVLEIAVHPLARDR